MTMVLPYNDSLPPIPAVVLNGGQMVKQAGALYVPVRGGDGRAHWAYEPKLRVQRIDLWCQEGRFADAPRDAAYGVTTSLGFASACEWCTCLAPLPTREANEGTGT